MFDVLVILFGGLFWLLMISGLFFSVFDDGSTTNNSSNLYSFEKEITVGDCLLISGWHVGCESKYAYFKVISVIELGEEAGNSQQRKVLLERLMYLDSFNALSTYRSKFDSKVYR